MEIRLYQVDAFTTELFSGNPAGTYTQGNRILKMEQYIRRLRPEYSR